MGSFIMSLSVKVPRVPQPPLHTGRAKVQVQVSFGKGTTEPERDLGTPGLESVRESTMSRLLGRRAQRWAGAQHGLTCGGAVVR